MKSEYITDMGINKFYDIADEVAHRMPIGQVAAFINQKLGRPESTRVNLLMDASHEIYKAALGTKTIQSMTDKSGKSTVHLCLLLNKLSNISKNNMTPTFVFDNPISPEEKREENDIRKDKRETAQKTIERLREATNLDPDMFALKVSKLEKQGFSINESHVADAKKILKHTGHTYYTAPQGYEAEHVASFLCNNGFGDAVWSGDSDCMAFGAPIMVRGLANKEGKGLCNVYLLDEVQRHVASKFDDLDQISFPWPNPILHKKLKDKKNKIGFTVKKDENSISGEKYIYRSDKYEITPEDIADYNLQWLLLRVAYTLGTDYNKGGVKGVGIKTFAKSILTEGKNFEKSTANTIYKLFTADIEKAITRGGRAQHMDKFHSFLKEKGFSETNIRRHYREMSASVQNDQ
jgi:5'-3' exonuclease